MIFPNKAKELRELKGIKQIPFACMAGLSQAQLWRIEKGYTRGSEKHRKAIAKALGRAVKDVFPVVEEPDD